MYPKPRRAHAHFLSACAVLLWLSATSVAQEKKPLRWGADATGGAPFVYKNNADQFVGFEWDLAEYLADKLGRKSVMQPGDWDKLPERLDQPADGAEGIDIVLNGYELNDELTKRYAATRPYYVYRLQLLARKSDDGIQGWSDLPARGGRPGKSVGVLGGSAAHKYTKELFGDQIDLRINPDVATVFGLVKDGRMDATVQDNAAATYFVNEIPELRKVDEPRRPGFYVMYLRKADSELRDQIDAAIAAGIRDGMLKRIYQKYDLWNDDQERLPYWTDRPWPPSGGDTPAGAEATSNENPWPRMLGELLRAALTTILLSVTSFPLAMALGMLVAVGRVYGSRLVALPLGVYVEVLRGTPLMLQLYTIYYLLPKISQHLALAPIEAGILGLAINYSAYEAENYRAGLLAIPRGQMEAALSLGMSRLTALRVVIVPQAFRIVIPPVTNDFIALFKDTSVCSVILITELTRKYNELYNFNRDYIVELAFVTAGLYLLMSYPLAIAARRLERMTANGREGGRA
ncbi:ABC transporter substrate-binding protein/permease [Fimbriiglobus ruber]|uniref:Glutamine transport system permease protein GlnP n=1 Tax=Fimbriiglobus ruber TaxID=1908690 RepID=A0A225E0R2_9BACT|nr:ABC transporter substrate-binding protein/permease [Fimbriiglobus ruber]OWK44408.1 Glutamine transport system permease protein GlnP [Fimbriiglobus ruber]